MADPILLVSPSEGDLLAVPVGGSFDLDVQLPDGSPFAIDAAPTLSLTGPTGAAVAAGGSAVADATPADEAGNTGLSALAPLHTLSVSLDPSVPAGSYTLTLNLTVFGVAYQFSQGVSIGGILSAAPAGTGAQPGTGGAGGTMTAGMGDSMGDQFDQPGPGVAASVRLSTVRLTGALLGADGGPALAGVPVTVGLEVTVRPHDGGAQDALAQSLLVASVQAGQIPAPLAFSDALGNPVTPAGLVQGDGGVWRRTATGADGSFRLQMPTPSALAFCAGARTDADLDPARGGRFSVRSYLQIGTSPLRFFPLDESAAVGGAIDITTALDAEQT